MSKTNCPTKRRKFNKINKEYYGYLFIIPFITIFLIFGLYPIINTLYLSFTDSALMQREASFVGLDNFKQLLGDKNFILALKNTWGMWVLNFIPQLAISMAVAVWVTNTRLRIKAVGFWRAVFYLPNILMPATVSVLFANIFSYYGPANQILVRMGLMTDSMQFFQNGGFTRGLVIFIQTWMWFGNTLIVLVAGMTSISDSLYEAAMVDGATSMQMFRKITLPCLKPILIYTLVTSLVGGLQMFDIPFLLTGGRGDPHGSIMTLNVLMFMKFNSSKGYIGSASAVGITILIMTTVCSMLIFYLLRNKDDEPKRKLFRKRGNI